jgi:riboflavin kinase/FMN adenylyltransferase
MDDARATRALAGASVAVGNFDGVHLGHRALVAAARARAAARGRPAAVLTFEPHPVRVLRPALAPPLLTPLARKLELLAATGLDACLVQPFDLGYAATRAAEFAARDLAGAMGCAEIVVGWDFTAGNERARVDALRPLLAAHGVGLHVVEPVAEGGLVVSSTKIREFLLEGNVEAAALLLTRPHDLDGEVVRGAGRGRGFGFATANVSTAGLLPANGVYAVRATVDGARHGGVANVGVKPTVESDGQRALEVHLLDFDGRDLYGASIRVGFVARLREERRFPSVDALRGQIAADAARAREVLAEAPM